MTRVEALAAHFVVALALWPACLHGQSCQEIFQPLRAHVGAGREYSSPVRATFTASIISSSREVIVAEGLLEFRPRSSQEANPAFIGDLMQYSSKDRWNNRENKSIPFDSQRSKTLHLEVPLTPSDAGVSVTFPDWAKPTVILKPQCANGFMYGVMKTASVSGSYTITLSRERQHPSILKPQGQGEPGVATQPH
jgi:hypothetical protein